MKNENTDTIEIDLLFNKMNNEALAAGYHLNPDLQFTKDLIEGLLTNTKRYGYPSCPCRLASGKKEEDLDIICPCDYRDADVSEYNTCYCGLYVSKSVVTGAKEIGTIPERRPLKQTRAEPSVSGRASGLPYPIWRCRVCGYLCARDQPPEVCPVCKAGSERFEKFMTSI